MSSWPKLARQAICFVKRSIAYGAIHAMREASMKHNELKIVNDITRAVDGAGCSIYPEAVLEGMVWCIFKSKQIPNASSTFFPPCHPQIFRPDTKVCLTPQSVICLP